MPEESTTPDPVERTRVFYETMDRDCDFDALGGFFTSDAVWDLTESHLGIYEGVAAIGDFLVGYWATWEDHHHEIEEILDLGHGVLLVAIREDGCPRGSNARVQARHLQVFQWVQGEIVRITGYPDIDEARAAAKRLAQERGQAMSHQNVEIVQGFYEALNGGDLAAVLEKIDPDFEWWQRDDAPEDDLIRAPEGFKAQWESIVDVLGEFRQEPTEFIDAGDYVVVPVMQVGRGRASEASIEQHEVHALRLRDGMWVELCEYHDKDEALKAVGLAD